MISVSLKGITHNYRNNIIFSPVSHDFVAGTNTVILGKNGSGKSTLLKLISSYMEPTQGSIQYSSENVEIGLENIPFLSSICSPSAILEEKLTLSETFDFYYSLRNLKESISKEEFFASCFLSESINKRVKELSSGMSQRLKLAFTFLTESSLILLDEPCMNLDTQGTDLYTSYINNFGKEATQIIASNSIAVEYAHCNAELKLR